VQGSPSSTNDDLSLPQQVESVVAQSYWKQIDGLRAIAFMLVFVSHCGPLQCFKSSNYLNKFIDFGFLGVDLFFVISGFLITVILLREKEQTGQISFRLFYLRRILRIFPIYYLVLITGVVLVPLLICGEQRFSNVASYLVPILIPFALFLGNFSASFNQVQIQNLETATHYSPSTFTGPFWSLCVEEQFYFFWPFVLSKLATAKIFFATTIFISLLSLLFRFLFFQLSHRIENLFAPHVIYYANSLCRLDALMIGAGIAGLVAYAPAILERSKKLGFGFFAFALLTYLSVVNWFPSIYTAQIQSVFMFSVVAIAFGASLFSSLVWSPFAKVLSIDAVAHFGRLTYAMYLFHRPVIILYRWLYERVIKEPVPALTQWICELFICLLVTYLLARLSWFAIESRCATLRRKLERIPTGIRSEA
jgi:peptidoglycan/LPS O-acetylase OafA/YrhL